MAPLPAMLHARVACSCGEKFTAHVTQGSVSSAENRSGSEDLCGLSLGISGRDKATCRGGLVLHFKSDMNRGHMSVNRLETAPDLHVTACTMLLEVDVSAQQLS